MKKLVFLLFVVICNILTAEENLKGRLAIGYSDAPTVRYWLTEKIGMEGKFSLKWNKDLHSSSYTYETFNYSIDIAGIYNIKKTKIINFNVATVIGYSYEKNSYPYIIAGLSAENYPTYKDNTYSFGIGPEFEVFIPSLPNLSLSSSVLLDYTYTSGKRITPYSTATYTYKDIYFSGNGFTALGLGIRYYFN